jgi:integrase
VGEVVRLSGGTVALQAAVDAFLDQHDLARSTRRVYRASLASLVAGLGPATAVGELSGPMLAGWFRGRTPRRRRRPGTGNWPRSAPPLAGGAAAAGSPATRPATLSGAASGSTALGPSPAVSSRGCLPAAISRCASEPCGGCCRTLWRLLYETAARANELLALDVEDLDFANRRARVHSKGGAVEWVF